MYSDEWIIKGYRSGEKISIENSEPIYYRFWYDHDQKVGATIDFEYAEDVFMTWMKDEKEKRGSV